MSDNPRATLLQYTKPYLGDSIIGIPRALVMLTRGDWTAAAMLNQILYWCGISDDPDNWFYKTDAAWMSELCLTRHQLTRYKAAVRNYGVETKLRKVKGAPTTHYRINEDILRSLISDFRKMDISENAEMEISDSAKMDLPQNQQIRFAVNAVNPLTEITSEITYNTDDRVLSSLRPTQTADHMVSDHIDDSHEMVGDPPEPFASWDDFEQYEKATAEIDAQQREYWKDKEIGEIFPVIHEEPPTSSAPPPPAVRKVNAHQTTVITPRDPIFDSVAKLQFGIDDTSAMPKGFGARIGRIVKVIVDAYKQRHNVTALSPNEREGLAGVHAKFWTWYTTVKYPSKGNEPPPQLRDAGKFAEYWLEYRTYRNAPRVEPVDVIPIARVGITTELPKPGGEWGVKHVR